MAINRSKIARQLLAQGGVSLDDAQMMAPDGEFLAYINPKEAQMLKDAGGSGIMTPLGIPSFVDFGGSGTGYGSAADTFSAASGNPGADSRSDFGGGDEGDSDNITFTSPKAIGPGTNPVVTYDTGPSRTTRNAMKVFSFLQDPFFGLFANRAINNELAREQALANARLSGSFMTPSQLPMRMTRNNTNRFNNNEDGSDNIVLPILPKIPKLPSDIEPEQSDMAEYIASIRGANPTAFNIPERFRLAEGGEPRQNYGLGKLVKKVTGAVKKVVKSDLGKAALGAAALYYAPGFGIKAQGGFAPFFSGLSSGLGFDKIPGGGITGTIVGASLLGGLLASKEPEQDINALSQRISDQTGIDVSKIRGEVQQAYQNKDTSTLAQKYPFLINQEYSASFATGGRIGFENGGSYEDFEEFMKKRGQGMKEFNRNKILEEFQKYMKSKDPTVEAAIGGKIEDKKEKEGIMMAGYGYNEAMADTYDSYLDMKKKGLIPPTMDFDEFLQEVVPEMGKKKGIERTTAAEGGMMNLGGNEMDLRGGGFVPIGAREKADDVPARLSKNEFVFTADAVRAAGGGSVDRGADLMYKTMKQLENKVV